MPSQREATATLAVLTARPDLMHLSVAMMSIIATELAAASDDAHANAGAPATAAAGTAP